MIKIKFGVSKRKAKKQAQKAYLDGHKRGYDYGEASVISNIQRRVLLLNPDYPVSVTELRKWVDLDG